MSKKFKAGYAQAMTDVQRWIDEAEDGSLTAERTLIVVVENIDAMCTTDPECYLALGLQTVLGRLNDLADDTYEIRQALNGRVEVNVEASLEVMAHHYPALADITGGRK